jgi:hypothetical protein
MMTDDEQDLYDLAVRRAAEKGARLELTDDPCQAAYVIDDPRLGPAVLQSSGPAGDRFEALRLLISVDEIDA